MPEFITSFLMTSPSPLGESFLQPEACAIVSQNFPMVVYAASVSFILPACVMAPILIRWSGLGEKLAGEASWGGAPHAIALESDLQKMIKFEYYTECRTMNNEPFRLE